ncbi:MAG: MBL fold metallo-hydrolase [Flavobacteriales bacterium]|nr:MBL fold metallo-hydrolase [Flavobacteriales bacterium]MBP6699426.1 MBL fold metallo-hydrolase [Flavobacteriales bacterium]
MPISLTFHGAAGTVTGSKHLLEVQRRDGKTFRVLLDCGMFQGEAVNGAKQDPNRRFGFDPTTVDALVLSHAHIDHSGLLPRLVAEGFKGPIYSTPATRDLCAIMLEDSARIQESDFAYDLKRAKRQGRALEEEEPLYAPEDVPPAMAVFQAMDYGEALGILPGITVSFTDAGHILGSAVVHLTIDDGERVLRLTFSGDVGRYVDRLLPEPVPFPQADVIICESTYGDRDHEPLAQAEDELLGHVLRTCVEKKGKLLIPAFSIGKTQEILYTLNKLSNAGRLPRIPVFVDSPLAISATAIARDHSRLFRASVREELSRDPDLFSFLGVEFVRAAERSKQLNSRQEPCIVIAASGMMEAGRIRHHLKHSLPDPRNTLLAVGFCAPGTLGAKILEGRSEVHIFGELVRVKAEVAKMEFYSAHGDRTELARFMSCQDPAKVKQVFLVHGIPASLNGLKDVLTHQGFKNIAIPKRGQRVEL